MKIKIARLCASYALLSLFLVTGIAWALPDVESHSRRGWVHADPASDPDNNSTLDLLKKVEYLQQEIQELRGKLEEQTYQLSQMKENQKKLYLDLDKRLQGQSTASTPVKAEPVSTTESLDITIPAAPKAVDEMPRQDTLAEEKAYQHAYQRIQSKDYEGATQAFQSLLKNFPQGKYVPNANYWLGEIYLTVGDLTHAYESFDLVYRRYPEHPKAADSLLKLGYVEYAKGQWKRSQELLAQVKNLYPGSTSAQLADARLQRMHKEGHL